MVVPCGVWGQNPPRAAPGTQCVAVGPAGTLPVAGAVPGVGASPAPTARPKSPLGFLYEGAVGTGGAGGFMFTPLPCCSSRKEVWGLVEFSVGETRREPGQSQVWFGVAAPSPATGTPQGHGWWQRGAPSTRTAGRFGVPCPHCSMQDLSPPSPPGRYCPGLGFPMPWGSPEAMPCVVPPTRCPPCPAGKLRHRLLGTPVATTSPSPAPTAPTVEPPPGGERVKEPLRARAPLSGSPKLPEGSLSTASAPLPGG